MDSKEFVDTSPMDGLYSGRILRAVFVALDIEDEVLDSRTAQRVLLGPTRGRIQPEPDLRCPGTGADHPRPGARENQTVREEESKDRRCSDGPLLGSYAGVTALSLNSASTLS